MNHSTLVEFEAKTTWPAWSVPYHWWGTAWATHSPRTLEELIAAGCLSVNIAATMVSAIAGGISVVVLADESVRGKTTLLTALLASLPSARTRIYWRGNQEPRDFLSQTSPVESTILVNEISPHLPVYVWGPAVRQLADCAGVGYQLLATGHARSAADWQARLRAQPNGLTPTQARCFELAAILTPDGVRLEYISRTGACVSQGGVSVARRWAR